MPIISRRQSISIFFLAPLIIFMASVSPARAQMPVVPHPTDSKIVPLPGSHGDLIGSDINDPSMESSLALSIANQCKDLGMSLPLSISEIGTPESLDFLRKAIEDGVHTVSEFPYDIQVNIEGLRIFVTAHEKSLSMRFDERRTFSEIPTRHLVTLSNVLNAIFREDTETVLDSNRQNYVFILPKSVKGVLGGRISPTIQEDFYYPSREILANSKLGFLNTASKPDFNLDEMHAVIAWGEIKRILTANKIGISDEHSNKDSGYSLNTTPSTREDKDWLYKSFYTISIFKSKNELGLYYSDRIFLTTMRVKLIKVTMRRKIAGNWYTINQDTTSDKKGIALFSQITTSLDKKFSMPDLESILRSRSAGIYRGGLLTQKPENPIPQEGSNAKKIK